MDLCRHDATTSIGSSQLPIWRYAHSRHGFGPYYVTHAMDAFLVSFNTGQGNEKTSGADALGGRVIEI